MVGTLWMEGLPSKAYRTSMEEDPRSIEQMILNLNFGMVSFRSLGIYFYYILLIAP